jgi:bacillithiol biosynthesis cysteine-adding enzyme BshC
MADSTERLDYRELSSYKALFLDYLYRFERLAPFFPAYPKDTDSWQQAAKRTSSYSRETGRVTAELREQNRQMDADSAVFESLDALEEGALAIVTGQQVGLLGGPLYTLYKAITAVELARYATSILGHPVVALFWMDADDHDFDEVRDARLLNPSNQLFTVSYHPTEIQDHVPVGSLRLEPSIEEPLSQLDELLSPTEFKPEVLGQLKETYAPGRTLSEAFGSWLLRMTRGSGLAVVNPASAELKSVAAPLFEREAADRSESTRLVEQTTHQLLSLGYHAQVSTSENRLNLFYAEPSRFHVVSEESGFRLSPDGPLVGEPEVRKLIQERPERFSPNVILRPVFQDMLLPTLAFVGGPNELTYLAQLGAVYQHFGVPMPVIVPRASLTVIERGNAKFLKRQGLALGDLRANDESLLNRLLREQAPPELEEDLSRARTCIHEITETLERDLASVDPTLVSTVRSSRGKMLHQVGELEAKSLRAIKKKDEILQRQFFSARTALFPNFEMQERQLSPVQYLVKYGWHFTEMVRESIDFEKPGHVLLYP